MRAKTIKAVLQKKHNDFISSIEDETVRNLVNKNSIITGGSIVSMLLGEEVNDYDYYFTDHETALAVTNYYVKKFKETHPNKDVEVKDEDGRIRVWIQSEGVAGEGNPQDDAEVVGEVFDSEVVGEPSPRYRPVFLTSNAITLSDKVQVIIRFYGDATEIHSNYDFVHCTCYWLSETGELVLPNEALQAILAKELIYRGSKYPLASVIRTRKFINRGWTINAGQYLKMCMQISELDLSKPEILEDQLVGVDLGFFQQVINYMKDRKEKDSMFKIDSSYVNEIVDRIF
jgi:hypothetical protein